MKLRNSRVVFGLCCWLAAMIVGPLHATAGPPTDQIKATVDKALIVLKDPLLKAAAKTQERRDQLKQILFARFDFNEMAKRALGADWRRRTPKEQEEFVYLFTELLERSYTETIEAYTNEKISYVGEKIDGTYADVNSKLFTDKGEEVPINYKVQLTGSEWRVYDVVVANISMVNNFRSQFTRVIANSSYEELIRRLKSKAEGAAQAQKN
jgi:phospholipid transport system substrate-binding protein